MGRRTRKRSESTRAERDAARAQRAREPQRAAARAPASERPAAPWGSFPLSELVILLGLVVLVWGFLSGEDGRERIAAGLVLASLGGGELALREHLAGFRSHSALLAGVVTFALVTLVAVVLGPVELWLLLLVGLVVFGCALYGLRELFKRRSGGLGFR